MRAPVMFATVLMAATFCGVMTTATRAGCFTGERVLVDPYGRPGTVISPTGGGSCRVHFDDPSVPDDWEAPYLIKSAAALAQDRVNATAGVRSGRYNITVGAGFYNGYLMIDGGSYEMFLPGGHSAGSGDYSFDASGPRVHWLSGPLTNPIYDGTQMVEAFGSMLKIRIGARAVATNSTP